MNTLTKIFLLGIALLVAFVFLTAPDVQQVRRGKADFHVNASDRLYFKNLRQYYYRSSLTKEDQFEAFILKKEEETSTSPLRFKILNNWRIDEAYIMLSDTAETSSGLIEVESDSDLQWSLDGMDAQDHMEMAMELFELLQREEQQCFYSSAQGGRVALWNQQKDRQLALIVLKDYFKLIGAL